MTKLAEDNLGDAVLKHIRGDFAMLKVAQTVGEALDALRSQDLAEKIVYFYVVDDNEKLLGVVPTRRLLMNGVDRKIADLMSANVVSIPHSMSVLDACEFFVLYRLLAFPVVDDNNKLLGVIDVGLFTDEIFDVAERQSAQDVFQLIGVHIDRARRGTPWAAFRYRFPWLLCNIAAGIACAFIAGMYEKFLDSVIVLALFIPVVLTLAEGVSMQSMTITLQALREGRIDWKRLGKSLRIELLTASMLGAASGGLVGLVSWAWKREPAVSAAIGSSIFLAVVTACLLGVLLPTVVRAFKGDPKIASGPVVLAAADVATLLFYFNLSAIILGTGNEILGAGVALEQRSFDAHRFTVARVDLHAAKLSLFWKTADGTRIGNFENLKTQLRRDRRRLVFATNAGIFAPGYTPLGLEIENGHELVPLNLKNGMGNFYMSPNGVFLIDGAGAHIVDSARYAGTNVHLATQSGPLLVIDGHMNPRFNARSDNLQIRSGVGVASPDRVFFVISDEPVSFYHLAAVFRNVLRCQSAMYLDGAISKFYPPSPQVGGVRDDFAGILAISEPG